MKPDEEKLRAWVEERVKQHGSIDKAWPRDEMTMRAWRELCGHLGIVYAGKARDLEAALARVADLAR